MTEYTIILRKGSKDSWTATWSDDQNRAYSRIVLVSADGIPLTTICLMDADTVPSGEGND